MLTGESEGKGRPTRRQAVSSDTQTTKSNDISETAPSKHPAESGLRPRRGKWEYRFKLNGKLYSRVTDLKAVPENIIKAQKLREAHLESLKSGKPLVKQISMPLDRAIQEFLLWYKSEHPRGGKCKWVSSLMASVQFYFFDVQKRPLVSIGPGDLERFKMWRRENDIHDTTLHKQLLLMRGFFSYARKNGWMKGDPFATGSDDEVKIPSQPDSTAMRVLSLDEEALYLGAARRISVDLFDVATIMKEQGPRPDEVMSLQQNHVDLFKRHFSIWDNSAEGKTRNAHRKLRMTEETFRIFSRRLSSPRLWVFPSPKNSGPRTTLQKSHEQATKDSGVKCRLYDMRHTFATRFALAGGSLPVLSKILGHADLAMLNKYVHPSQEDMDRGMEWFSSVRPTVPDLAEMLVEFTTTNNGSGRWSGPPFGPPAMPGNADLDHRPPMSQRKRA